MVWIFFFWVGGHEWDGWAIGFWDGALRSHEVFSWFGRAMCSSGFAFSDGVSGVLWWSITSPMEV